MDTLLIGYPHPFSAMLHFDGRAMGKKPILSEYLFFVVARFLMRQELLNQQYILEVV